MKQTGKDSKNKESLEPRGGSGAGGSAEKPRSWREYIEETEAAEKQAERQAARERAAQIKREKHSAAAWKEKAKAAMDGAKTALDNAKGAVNEAKAALDEARAARNEAKAARNEARAARNQSEAAQSESKTAGRRLKEEAKKEKAVRAPKAGNDAGNAALARVRDVTAGGREQVNGVLNKVRSVVASHPVSPLLYVTLLAVVVGAVFFNSTYTRAYALNVDGQEIGVVSSEDDLKAIVSNVESRASDILGESYNYDAEKISVTPVFVTPDELSDTAVVEETLFEDVGALVQAYGLRVDGNELGYAATEQELQDLLKEAAAPYLTEDTIGYDFVEDVEVYPVELPSNTQYDLEKIRATLSEFRVEQSTYVVKKGDTFNAIAYSLDMWPIELSVLNPDVMVDKLWVDQELIIQEAVPFLSVQNTTDETYEETVPSPVEYIETADLYVGDTKIKEQGEDGLQRVNAHVTYVNGVEVDREILTTETLKEPTTTYAYTGTTPRPVTASNGYFIWPVRGTITSNFGGRNLWGRYDFHLGLDIACRTGTSIKAADGGTVIKSGWNGSYGKLVAIRHDNGYVTYYAHNSELLVSVGQKVYQGQIIARAGATGNASGPHCHFEVRINNTSVNPRNYLP
mgnify:CR=1 FL=1